MSAERFFDSLYGNLQLIKYLSSGVDSKHLPHALIIEGPEGSGKKSTAYMICAAMQPDFSDKIMRRITPDITYHTLEAGKKTIGVSTVREIREAAYIMPQELSVRVFIIDNASLMTDAAQNALLKILEEPPEGVYFFLLSENASALLPTVRSRAPVVRMQVFDEGELEEYIVKNNGKAARLSGAEPEAFKMLLRSSKGAIGKALEFLEQNSGNKQKVREKTDKLIELLSEGKTSDIVFFLYKLGFSREELDILMLNLAQAVRDMLAVKYETGAEPMYFLSLETAETRATEFTRGTLMAVYSVTEKLRDALTVNVNAELFSLRIAEMLSSALK